LSGLEVECDTKRIANIYVKAMVKAKTIKMWPGGQGRRAGLEDYITGARPSRYDICTIHRLPKK